MLDYLIAAILGCFIGDYLKKRELRLEKAAYFPALLAAVNKHYSKQGVPSDLLCLVLHRMFQRNTREWFNCLRLEYLPFKSKYVRNASMLKVFKVLHMVHTIQNLWRKKKFARLIQQCIKVGKKLQKQRNANAIAPSIPLRRRLQWFSCLT